MGPDDENSGLINDLVAPPTIPDANTMPPQVPGIVQREPTPKMDAYRGVAPKPSGFDPVTIARSNPVMGLLTTDPATLVGKVAGDQAEKETRGLLESLGPLGAEYTGLEQIPKATAKLAEHAPEASNWLSRMAEHLGVNTHHLNEAIIGAGIKAREALANGNVDWDAAHSSIAPKGKTTYRGYGGSHEFNRIVTIPRPDPPAGAARWPDGADADRVHVNIGGSRNPQTGELVSGITFSNNGHMGAETGEGAFRNPNAKKILAFVQNAVVDYAQMEQPHRLHWSAAGNRTGGGENKLQKMYSLIAPRIAKSTMGEFTGGGTRNSFDLSWPHHGKFSGEPISSLLKGPDVDEALRRLPSGAYEKFRLHIPLSQFASYQDAGGDLDKLLFTGNRKTEPIRAALDLIKNKLKGPWPTTMMRQQPLPFSPEHQRWWQMRNEDYGYGDSWQRPNVPQGQQYLPFRANTWRALLPENEGGAPLFTNVPTRDRIMDYLQEERRYNPRWFNDQGEFLGTIEQGESSASPESLLYSSGPPRRHRQEPRAAFSGVVDPANRGARYITSPGGTQFPVPHNASMDEAIAQATREARQRYMRTAPARAHRASREHSDEWITDWLAQRSGEGVTAEPYYHGRDSYRTIPSYYNDAERARANRYYDILDPTTRRALDTIEADSPEDAITRHRRNVGEQADRYRRAYMLWGRHGEGGPEFRLERVNADSPEAAMAANQARADAEIRRVEEELRRQLGVTLTRKHGGRAEGGEVPDPYRMEKGDTPSSVASKFGISLPDLMGWNKLTNTQARHLPIGYGLVTHGPAPAENKPASGGVLGPSETATPVELVASPAAPQPQPDAQPAAPKQPPGFWDKFDAWIDPVRVLSGHAGEVDYNPSISDYLSTALFGLGAGRGSAPAAADMPRSPEFISRLTPKEIAREQYLQKNHGNNPPPSWYRPPIGRTGPLTPKELAREIYLQKYHGNHPMPYWYKGPQAPVEGTTPVDPDRLGFASGGRVAVGHLHSDVPGRTDKLHIRVPSGSYVIPADIVSGLGQGNTMAGAKHLERCFGPAIQPMAGGGRSDDDHVEIMAAGGEYVIPPHAVAKAGGGDMKRGHARLDAFVKKGRKDLISTLKKLPGPAK